VGTHPPFGRLSRRGLNTIKPVDPDRLKNSFTFHFWHKFFIIDDVKLQSTTALNERMWHFMGGGSKHTLTLLLIFRGFKIPNPKGLHLCQHMQLTVRLHCGWWSFLHGHDIFNDHGIGSDIGYVKRLRWGRGGKSPPLIKSRPRHLKQHYQHNWLHGEEVICTASNRVISNGALEIRLVSLRACIVSCDAAYCNRSCLIMCGWVCYHDNSKLRVSILTKLGL